MAACVVRILGSQSPEKVSGGQMQIVEHVLGETYFAWGQMFLTYVQRQLTAAKESGKGFCYGSFLCAFFMERVPTLRLRVPVRAGGLREPRMVRWGEMMHRRGGGDVGRYFTQELYLQWLQLPLTLDDYPYRDMDFTGDPDAPRPPGQAWGPDGMYDLFALSSFMYMIYC